MLRETLLERNGRRIKAMADCDLNGIRNRQPNLPNATLKRIGFPAGSLPHICTAAFGPWHQLAGHRREPDDKFDVRYTFNHVLWFENFEHLLPAFLRRFQTFGAQALPKTILVDRSISASSRFRSWARLERAAA
jgi:hypothetical protein